MKKIAILIIFLVVVAGNKAFAACEIVVDAEGWSANKVIVSWTNPTPETTTLVEIAIAKSPINIAAKNFNTYKVVSLPSWSPILQGQAQEVNIVNLVPNTAYNVVARIKCAGSTTVRYFTAATVFTLWAGYEKFLVEWDPPTTNEDCTPVDLAGYAVYFGYKSRVYNYYMDIGNVCVRELTLPIGEEFYFSVVAYDAIGNTSEYSNEGYIDTGTGEEIIEPDAPSICQ